LPLIACRPLRLCYFRPGRRKNGRRGAVERFEPAMCRCGFGLLCCASGGAMMIFVVTLLAIG
jgi:hypothetical protein